MPRQNVALAQFNRGLISPLALARVDLKRVAFSAEDMTNWMPRVFGSMMLRPGTEYLGSSRANAAAKFIDFVFATVDTAKIEITDSNLRVWVDGTVITRPSVSTSVTNGTFDSDLTGWTDADESGGTSAWVTGGYMGLTGNGSAAAIRTQTLSIAAADVNVEHALHIVIARGPVTFRCGSTSGGDEYITETTLNEGSHSLAFTPTGSSAFLRFESRLKRQVLVNSCAIESAGAMTLSAPWLAEDLDYLRWDQSGDVVFVACDGYMPRRIERRTERSWSVCLYQPENGPFRLINTGPITITPNALSGNITLTASAALFRSTLVGALFKIVSSGQRVTASVTGANQFTSAIEVSGVDNQRVFTVVISGTWTATVRLQRSLSSDTGPWADVQSYTANTSASFDDGLDNQIAWYRIGVKTGEYTSGTAEVELNYTIGSIAGVVKITGVTNSTTASAEVFSDLGGTSATSDWYEGEWSDYRGFPTSVGFVEGRLGWAGKNGVWLSESDAFDSFDDEVEGDSGPISRTIGAGPVDTINWMLALQRLVLGAEGAEFVCKSSSQDEPLTPTAFNIKAASTQGSAAVRALKVDKAGIYVQRGGTRVMQISIDANDDYEYGSDDLTKLVPEVTQPRVTRVAVQRQPDTRIHCVRSDGKVAIAVVDRNEEVLCWLLYQTDGYVEDVVILPGAEGESEDKVYYFVRREVATSGSLNLITDGGFDSGISNWTTGATGTGRVAWYANALLLETSSAGAGTAFAEYPITTVVGTTYRIKFDINDIGTGGLTARVGSSSGGSDAYSETSYTSVSTNNIFTFTATGTTSYLRFYISGVNQFCLIDNVSAVANSNVETRRYLEKWAKESECQGGALNKQADSFETYSGTSTTTITGLSHLEGKSVVVWGNGKYLGSYTVSSGQITGLSEAVTSAVIGLTYSAPWQSTKLAYAAGIGTALLQKKKISQLGLIMRKTHASGVKYGKSFDSDDLMDLPGIEAGAIVNADTIHDTYDYEAFPFPGEWNTDSRLCLLAQAPKPCTILAGVISVETHDKS